LEQNWIKTDVLDDVLDARAYQIKFIENISKLKKCNLQLEKLNQLCDSIYRGNTPAHIEGKIIDGALLLKTVNVRSNELDLGKVFSMEPLVYESEKRFQLFEKDICITIMGATEEIVGRSWVYNNNIGKACFSDGIAKIKNVNIDPYYLSTYINSEYGHLSVIQFSGSSTRSYVTNTQLGEILVPTPSVQIQKYIGDKVRKAEELREEAKRLKKEAEELLDVEIGGIDLYKESKKYHWIKSNKMDDRIDGDFYDLKYEILVNIEEKFDCYMMEDIIVDKYTGKTPDKSYDYEDGIPLIVVKNVEENVINLDNVERKVRDNDILKKIEVGDLLITRVGSVGIVSIVEENDAGAFLSDNVICIKLKNMLEKRYIAFYLNSKYGKLMVERWTKGAVQGVINYPSINNFKIPILKESIMKDIDFKITSWKYKLMLSKQLIEEAKQDVENLIEGNFDMSKIKETN